LDERGKLPGRGAYLCARRECLDKAQKSRALARALKTEIPDEIYARLGEHIDSYREKFSAAADSRPAELRSAELRSILGLSRRASLLHIGMDSVKSQCAKAKKSLLILTVSDCSESVKDFACKQAENGGERIGIPLNIEEISAALGANNVQLVALPARSGLADRIRKLM
jgi:hypothetical protein